MSLHLFGDSQVAVMFWRILVMATLIETGLILQLKTFLENVDVSELSEEEYAVLETIFEPLLEFFGVDNLEELINLFQGVEQTLIKTFTIEIEGLKLDVQAVYNPNTGNTEVVITAIEGHADLNAFYWANDVDEQIFSGFIKQDSSLNMNGVDVDWVDAIKLSSTGLGWEGTDKETYISAGTDKDSFTFTLEGVSLDELEIIGIRATSASNEEGGIKEIAEEDVAVEDPEDDDNDDSTAPGDPVEGDPEDEDDLADPPPEDEDPGDEDPDDPDSPTDPVEGGPEDEDDLGDPPPEDDGSGGEEPPAPAPGPAEEDGDYDSDYDMV
jgi:hypothetical protein